LLCNHCSIFSQNDTLAIEFPVKDTGKYFYRIILDTAKTVLKRQKQRGFYYRIIPPQYKTYFDTLIIKPELTCSTNEKDFDLVRTIVKIKDDALIWDSLKINKLPCCYEDVKPYMIVNKFTLLGFVSKHEYPIAIKFKVPKKETLARGCYDFANKSVKTHQEIKIIKKEKLIQNGDLEIKEQLEVEQLDTGKWSYSASGIWSEWRQAGLGCPKVCPSTMKAIQEALKTRGYLVDINTTDIMDKKTKKALVQFQLDNEFKVGTLNIQTLRALGVQ
jgi:hypothetical protein